MSSQQLVDFIQEQLNSVSLSISSLELDEHERRGYLISRLNKYFTLVQTKRKYIERKKDEAMNLTDTEQQKICRKKASFLQYAKEFLIGV